jgi:predicted dehydrogenase
MHPEIGVLLVTGSPSQLGPVQAYLQSIPHIRLRVLQELPHELSPYDVVLTSDVAGLAEGLEHLEPFVRDGGACLALVHLTETPLPEWFGAQPVPVGPVADLRVLFKNPHHPLARRLPDAIYLKGRYQCLNKTDEHVETILYADWHYQHSPVLVRRLLGKGQVGCTTLQDYDHPVFRQILYRLLRDMAGYPFPEHALGVGILGYSPFVGQEHGVGVEATEGLKLVAACDVNSERLRQAREDFPHLRTYESAQALAEAPEIDVVIICTPPNTHASLSLNMMDARKHVLCEKPLALTRKEALAMVEMSEKQGVHLSCHQNRRWDVDYLAIKQALTDGLIGHLFYMETFVGDFKHPCGYWHSHDVISGGTAYDWGAHYLDWIVSLVPDRPEAVIGTRHKLVWHDVTNADQERILIRFAGGQEAEFLHSDIAAWRKPKWYILGTEGAIVGYWQDVTEYEIDPILYFREHRIPPTEMFPDLSLHRRHHSGQIVAQKLALPERSYHGLYGNLADHLLIGEPIAAPLNDSVLVVAILEAAAKSASGGGTVEILDE